MDKIQIFHILSYIYLLHLIILYIQNKVLIIAFCLLITFISKAGGDYVIAPLDYTTSSKRDTYKLWLKLILQGLIKSRKKTCQVATFRLINTCTSFHQVYQDKSGIYRNLYVDFCKS